MIRNMLFVVGSTCFTGFELLFRWMSSFSIGSFENTKRFHWSIHGV